MACEHTDWLHVLTSPPSTQDFNRLQALIAAGVFPDPENQTPSVLTFIGGTAKNRMLRKLLGRPQLHRNRRRADIHIHVLPRTSMTPNPILIADCALPELTHSEDGFSETSCHEVITRPLAVRGERLRELVLASLLGPFTDVLCIFMSDFGCVRDAATLLASWIDAASRTFCQTRVRPGLLLVDFQAVDDPAPILINILTEEFLLKPYSYFSRFDVLRTPPSLLTRNSLMGHLSPILEESLVSRQQARTLFTMTHFEALFRSACDCSSGFKPFEFVTASRLRNPVPESLGRHISTFLGNFSTQEAVFNSAIPLIASSLLLDYAPPGMHLFHPQHVFQTLYQGYCKAAIGTLSRSYSKPILEELEHKFQTLLESMECNKTSSTEVHRCMLREQRTVIKDMRSEISCFCCLARVPEKRLPCNHSLCETCIQIFGWAHQTEPYTLFLQNCIFCGMDCQSLAVNLKPPTAGVRILSVDGGGVRGVIPLRALIELEDAICELIGFRIPIQQNFDMAFGTSSGGLIVLGLFLNGWTVVECLKQFISLAESAFRPQLLVACLADSRYSARGLEGALKAAFGERRMLDWPANQEFSAKVAVTATTVNDTSPCLFSNYNKDVIRDGCGYSVEGSREGSHEILVWEAFYPPKLVANLGLYQDGGLIHNNPSKIAIWESRFIWPRETGRLDTIVSLGTGTGSSPAPQNSIWYRFIPRLYRSFMLSLDGQKIWTELYNDLPEGKSDKYFRFNFHFGGKEPEIDDLCAMYRLNGGTVPNSNHQVNKKTELEVAETLIAKQFYFELEELPVYRNGRYTCRGHILCRLAGAPQAALLNYLHNTLASFHISETKLGNDLKRPFRLWNNRFFEPVLFCVKSKAEEISISLHGITKIKARIISGFPTTISGLVKNQDLDSAFGTYNHSKRVRVVNDYTLPRTPPKRPCVN
ncbi:acyl transferase/acyl hydrolase/lysophospholipase [Trichophaea hybrida]|nr:acyl transferase/acyl hydrolase/lysophospholipase [Trichophaea hybrida]